MYHGTTAPPVDGRAADGAFDDGRGGQEARGILCRIGSRRHSKRATRSGASWRRIEGTQDVSLLHASCFKSTNSMTQRRCTEHIGRRQDPRHRRRSSPPRSYLQSLRCDICLIHDGQQRTLLMIVACSSLYSGRLIQTPSDAKGLRGRIGMLHCADKRHVSPGLQRWPDETRMPSEAFRTRTVNLLDFFATDGSTSRASGMLQRRD